jgi:hypothetical protein
VTVDAALSRDVQRVHDLIRLAVDSAAAEAEARTAALTACKLIFRRKLLVVAVAPQPQPAPPPRPPPPPPPRQQPSGARITSRYRSFCHVCGGAVEVGQACWWTRGIGVEHLRCRNQGAA